MKSIKDPIEIRKIEGFKRDVWLSHEKEEDTIYDPVNSAYQNGRTDGLLHKYYIDIAELAREMNRVNDSDIYILCSIVEKEIAKFKEKIKQEFSNKSLSTYFKSPEDEEDETRKPQPDEPEEYWIRDWLTISIKKDICSEKRDGKSYCLGAIHIINCGHCFEYYIRSVERSCCECFFYKFSNIIDCLKWIYENKYIIRNCGNDGRDKYKREFLRTELNKLIAFYFKVFNGLIEEVR